MFTNYFSYNGKFLLPIAFGPLTFFVAGVAYHVCATARVICG